MIKKVKKLGEEIGADSSRDTANLDESLGNQSIEPTLVKLNEFIHMRIKWSDFTTVDKINLVEMFVTHHKTLMAIYTSVFPGTTNVDQNYDNLSLTQGVAGVKGDQNKTLLDDSLLYTELLNGDLNDRTRLDRDTADEF